MQLTELPAKHMFVGKTHLTVSDIRSFNNLQRLDYELHQNDCRCRPTCHSDSFSLSGSFPLPMLMNFSRVAHCHSLILSAGCIVTMGLVHFQCNTAIAPCAELPSLQLRLVLKVCSSMQALCRQDLPLHDWCGCRHSAVQATHLQTEQAAGAVERLMCDSGASAHRCCQLVPRQSSYPGQH